MVHIEIFHAKNQHPWPKSMVYRPWIDKHTDTKTHRQTDNYAPKPEVDLEKFLNDFKAQLTSTHRLYIPDFKSPCHLV